MAQKPNVVDVGNEQQVVTRKRKGEIRRERELNEIKELLAKPYGRGFLYRLLDKCGVYRPTDFRSELDLAMQAAQRDVGLWIITEIEQADGEGFIRLIREKQQRENEG